MDHFTKKASFIVVLTTFSSLLFLVAAIPSSRNIHIVRRDIMSDLTQFCQKTTNPTLCTKTIQPHVENGAVDPFKALDAEVDATKEEAKKTISDIKSLLDKSDTSKSEKDSLDTCADQYKSMLDAIAETKKALNNKDVVTAKFKFSAVLSYQAACQDSFTGGKIPFPEDSDAVYQLGGNCLDIIADMEKSARPATLPPPAQQAPSAFSNVIGTVS